MINGYFWISHLFPKNFILTFFGMLFHDFTLYFQFLTTIGQVSVPKASMVLFTYNIAHCSTSN